MSFFLATGIASPPMSEQRCRTVTYRNRFFLIYRLSRTAIARGIIARRRLVPIVAFVRLPLVVVVVGSPTYKDQIVGRKPVVVQSCITIPLPQSKHVNVIDVALNSGKLNPGPS